MIELLKEQKKILDDWKIIGKKDNYFKNSSYSNIITLKSQVINFFKKYNNNEIKESDLVEETLNLLKKLNSKIYVNLNYNKLFKKFTSSDIKLYLNEIKKNKFNDINKNNIINLKGIHGSIFYELYGLFHNDYPISNKSSKDGLKFFYNENIIDFDNYNEFTNLFNKFKNNIYIPYVLDNNKEKQLYPKVPLNLEIDQLFNYIKDKLDKKQDLIHIISNYEKVFNLNKKYYDLTNNKYNSTDKMLEIKQICDKNKKNIKEFLKNLDQDYKSISKTTVAHSTLYQPLSWITFFKNNDYQIQLSFDKDNLNLVEIWLENIDINNISIFNKLKNLEVDDNYYLYLEENKKGNYIKQILNLDNILFFEKYSTENLNKFLDIIKNSNDKKLKGGLRYIIKKSELKNYNFNKLKEIFHKNYDFLKKLIEGIDMSKENNKLVNETLISNAAKLLKDKKQIILYGPPGTGKTWNTKKIIEKFINKFTSEKYDLFEKEEGRVEFITFHQSYAYEEFIEGIKPKLNENDIKYSMEPGKFKKMCESTIINFKDIFDLTKYERKKLFKNSKPYFLIIDEINRGNISKIFGELITLLEKDKRLGEGNEIITNLPYSNERFGVPSNLYIIGTMNTADRSITNLDIALRRRFGFIQVLPNSELIDVKLKDSDINLKDLLNELNKRIGLVLDQDRLIGHSYFMNLNKPIENLNSLKKRWFNEIIPLLQEYFYNDWEKLEFVIGNGFFEKEEKYNVLDDELSIHKIKTSEMKVSDFEKYILNIINKPKKSNEKIETNEDNDE